MADKEMLSLKYYIRIHSKRELNSQKYEKYLQSSLQGPPNLKLIKNQNHKLHQVICEILTSTNHIDGKLSPYIKWISSKF